MHRAVRFEGPRRPVTPPHPVTHPAALSPVTPSPIAPPLSWCLAHLGTPFPTPLLRARPPPSLSQTVSLILAPGTLAALPGPTASPTALSYKCAGTRRNTWTLAGLPTLAYRPVVRERQHAHPPIPCHRPRAPNAWCALDLKRARAQPPDPAHRNRAQTFVSTWHASQNARCTPLRHQQRTHHQPLTRETRHGPTSNYCSTCRIHNEGSNL